MHGADPPVPVKPLPHPESLFSALYSLRATAPELVVRIYVAVSVVPFSELVLVVEPNTWHDVVSQMS